MTVLEAISEEARCSGGFNSLTTRYRLASFDTVPFQCLRKKGPTSSRLIGAALLLFVFLLPFHLHFFTSTAQVAKECSCVHGTRTEAGLAPASTPWIPVLVAQPLASEPPDRSVYVSLHNHGIRAPPLRSL